MNIFLWKRSFLIGERELEVELEGTKDVFLLQNCSKGP